jgi:heparanase 1
MYIDRLCVSAQRGVRITMRQALHGYFYAMFNYDNEPNPDAWSAVLFQSLVGDRVLGVSAPTRRVEHSKHSVFAGDDESEEDTALNPQYVRIYAFCAQPTASHVSPSLFHPRSVSALSGAVVVVGLNLLLNDTASIDASLAPGGGAGLGARRWEYVLSSPLLPASSSAADVLDTLVVHGVALNGRMLAQRTDLSLPTMMPVQRDAGTPMLLPPASFAFFVFPDAQAPACS